MCVMLSLIDVLYLLNLRNESCRRIKMAKLLHYMQKKKKAPAAEDIFFFYALARTTSVYQYCFVDEWNVFGFALFC